MPPAPIRRSDARKRTALVLAVPLAVSLGAFGASSLGACGDDEQAKPGVVGGAGTSGAGGMVARAGSGGVAGTGGGAGEGGSAGAPSTSFCGTDGVSKGPWVVASTETTARVRWESCVTGRNQVTAKPEAGGDGTTITAVATESTYEVTSEYKAFVVTIPHDLPGTWIMHEATIEGLAPSTCYGFSVAGGAEDRGRFCTARASGEPFTFLALGDTNPGLGDSTKGVLDVVLPSKPDFTLHQGDLQYYSSGLETYASWFPLMAPLLRQGAILAAVGNHESEKPDEFEAYYQRFFGSAGEGVGSGKTYYRFTSGGLHFFALDTEQSLKADSEQATWLVAELAVAQQQPGFQGSVIWMHRPFATCGESAELFEERQALEPSFEKFGARLVLCGHVHGYERFSFGGPVMYVVTGGGGGLKGDPDDNIDRPDCASRVAKAGTYHGLVLRVENGQIGGTALDFKGNTLDTFSVALP